MNIPEKLDIIFQEAILARASDIHIESYLDRSQRTCMRVRFRIDGLLQPWGEPVEQPIGLALIARLKVLSNLNTADKRLPQDGSLSLQIASRAYDVRVATFPSIHGEKVVLRLLDRSGHVLALDQLGFAFPIYEKLKEIADSSQGFFLVTGPTGSGKTTTLHAILASSMSMAKNVVTLEDPVEYTISGITQTSIHPAIGFTFEKALRSVLRQDPDTIMLGEIRDRETAQIAIQAALTGHFMLSTLHTADATQALIRLLDMGIEPFLLTGSLRGVLAQRLARKLCLHCRFKIDPSLEELETAQRFSFDLQRSFKCSGCEQCRMTGRYGRTTISELLLMTPQIRSLLMSRPSYDQLHAEALSTGMIPLAKDGIVKVSDGVINFEELLRVMS